jgi:hypothetical protein
MDWPPPLQGVFCGFESRPVRHDIKATRQVYVVWLSANRLSTRIVTPIMPDHPRSATPDILEDAVKSLVDDKFVRDCVEHLDARVIPASIEPVDEREAT